MIHKTLFILSFLLLGTAQAQVPLRFKLSYTFWNDTTTHQTPFRLVVVNPDGHADTLSRVPLRQSRRSSRNNVRHYNHQLALPGHYRLLLTVDTCTLELPFTLDGTELLVDAGLNVGYNDTYYNAYPTLNLYRRAPSAVSLYYLGVDTSRAVLFNIVNRSDDTLFDGRRNHFHINIGSYIEDQPPQIEHYIPYHYTDEAPLMPHSSRRLKNTHSPFGPGRCLATLCYTTDPSTFYNPAGIAHGGCVFYSPSNASVSWLHIINQTWFVASCSFFLTTLDFE